MLKYAAQAQASTSQEVNPVDSIEASTSGIENKDPEAAAVAPRKQSQIYIIIRNLLGLVKKIWKWISMALYIN